MRFSQVDRCVAVCDCLLTPRNAQISEIRGRQRGICLPPTRQRLSVRFPSMAMNLANPVCTSQAVANTFFIILGRLSPVSLVSAVWHGVYVMPDNLVFYDRRRLTPRCKDIQRRRPVACLTVRVPEVRQVGERGGRTIQRSKHPSRPDAIESTGLPYFAPRCFFTKSIVSVVQSSLPRGVPGRTSHSIPRASIFSFSTVPKRGW